MRTETSNFYNKHRKESQIEQNKKDDFTTYFSRLTVLLLLHWRSSRTIRNRTTLTLQLLPGLPSTTACRAARAQLDDKRDQVKRGRKPHKGHHAGAQLGADVQVLVRVGEDVLEDGEHDGGHDGGDDGEERGGKGEQGEGEGAEEDKGATAVGRVGLVNGWVGRDGLGRPRGDSQGGEKDEDEGEDGGNDEETEHPVRGHAGDLESIGDVCGEGNFRAVSIGINRIWPGMYILVAPESNSLRRIFNGLNQ